MTSAMVDLDTRSVPEEGVSLAEFLRANGHKPEFVMVRLDGAVIKTRDLAAARVTRGSQVRVYRLVGGG